MYSNEAVCLHKTRYMRIHCPMTLFVCIIELEYIGIYCQIDIYVHARRIHRNTLMEWACPFAWNWNTDEVIDTNGPVCLKRIGRHEK